MFCLVYESFSRWGENVGFITCCGEKQRCWMEFFHIKKKKQQKTLNQMGPCFVVLPRPIRRVLYKNKAWWRGSSCRSDIELFLINKEHQQICLSMNIRFADFCWLLLTSPREINILQGVEQLVAWEVARCDKWMAKWQMKTGYPSWQSQPKLRAVTWWSVAVRVTRLEQVDKNELWTSFFLMAKS